MDVGEKEVCQMIRITDPSECCGCTACMAVCPYDAVHMKADRLGFQYPEVDIARCVDCGLCERVCAFAGALQQCHSVPEDISLKVEAVRHRDDLVVSRSQSGGAFTALSDYILDEGGVIYGAVFNNPKEVCHKRAGTREERDAMRGSKYVQSDMGTVFRQVREDLASGRKVLFTGTPCQVAGLKSYIPESLRANLVLVDFICHGVPSPSVWRDYVSHMERKGRLVKATFRDKAAGGWKKHVETFEYDSGKLVVRETFRILFYKNIMLRHSCSVCPYNILDHKSDVTIADFWGVDEVCPEMDGDAGVSMVICNTERGSAILQTVSETVDSHTLMLDYAIMSRRNPNLLRPAKIYKDRMKFEEEFARKGFLYVARRWSDLGIRYRLWQLKRLLIKSR